MLRKEQIPNLLIFVRVFLTILVIVFLVVEPPSGHIYLSVDVFRFLAATCFAIAAFTDFLDGHLSRKWKCTTNFGKTFDPLADKLLVITSLLLLMFRHSNVWIPLGCILILRDVIMDTLRCYLFKKNIIIPAVSSAKLKTICQMIGLLIIMFLVGNGEDLENISLANTMGHGFLFVAVCFSLYSFVVYLKGVIYARKFL